MNNLAKTIFFTLWNNLSVSNMPIMHPNIAFLGCLIGFETEQRKWRSIEIEVKHTQTLETVRVAFSLFSGLYKTPRCPFTPVTSC